MKKIFAFATSLAVAATLAACGSSQSTPAQETTQESGSAAAADASQEQATITISTEGFGVISWSQGDAAPEFDDDKPMQSGWVTDALGSTVHIEARDYAEYEGYHFVKWTKDGADYSTDNRIDVQIEGDAEYTAVFDLNTDEIDQ